MHLDVSRAQYWRCEERVFWVATVRDDLEMPINTSMITSGLHAGVFANMRPNRQRSG